MGFNCTEAGLVKRVAVISTVPFPGVVDSSLRQEFQAFAESILGWSKVLRFCGVGLAEVVGGEYRRRFFDFDIKCCDHCFLSVVQGVVKVVGTASACALNSAVTLFITALANRSM